MSIFEDYGAFNELVSGQNVNCSSKYNIYLSSIFAEKMWVAFHIFLAKLLVYLPCLMIEVLTIC